MISTALTALYVLLGVLLLSLNLRSRWAWQIKLLAILVTSGAYFGTYVSIEEIKGWPVPGALPDQFSVHYIVVDEPSKATGEEGRIYIWLRNVDDSGMPFGKPRVHEMLFSEALAQRSQEAIGILMDGGKLNAVVEVLDGEVSDQEREGSSSSVTATGGDLLIKFLEVGAVDLPPKADPTTELLGGRF